MLATLALTICNVEFLSYGSVTASEMLFTLIGLLVLLSLEKVCRSPHRVAWLAASVVAILAACYVRPNGLALLPAAACFLAIRKQWAAAILLPAVCLVGVLPWFVREKQLGKSEQTYMYYALHSGASQGSRLVTAGDMVSRVAEQSVTRLRQLGQLVIAMPSSPPRVEKPRSGVLGLGGEGTAGPETQQSTRSLPGLVRHGSRYLLAAMVLLGGALLWRKGGSAAHWYAVWTLALLLVGPFATARYLLPLLPIWSWFLVGGLHRLGGSGPARWRGFSRPAATAAIVGACVLAAVLTGIGTASRVELSLSQRGRPYDAPERYRLAGDDWVRYVQTAHWLKQNAPQQAVVIARKPDHVYWITGQHAVNAFWSAPGTDMWRALTANLQYGPVYIIEDAFGERYCGEDLVSANLIPTLRAHRNHLHLVHVTEPPVTAVWTLTADGPGRSLQNEHTGSQP